MSVTETKWITGEELGRVRRRLIELGVPDDAPEFQELWRRVDERDDYLFERYGRPYMETHPGKWIAISLEGEVFLGDTATEVTWRATERVGRGNYSKRKLTASGGHELRS